MGLILQFTTINLKDEAKKKLKLKLKISEEIVIFFNVILVMKSNLQKLILNKVIDIFPELNVLINSASIFKKSNILNTENNLFNETMDINFKAPFYLSRDFAKIVKQEILLT